MRALVGSLILVTATAAAAPSTLKLAYEAKGSPKGKAAMQASVGKHMDELEKAANSKWFDVHFGLHLEGKTDTTCRITADIGEKGTIFASLSGSATLSATGELATTSCIDAVIGDLIKAKIVPLMEKKSH